MNDRLRHPPQLKILFFTEMWERFGFYLMLGLLQQYLSDKQKGGMGWSDAEASALVGTYLALVYLTPFIGGLLADRLLGFRISILIGAFLMMLGYFLMAIPDESWLYVALGVIILGNGAFKPNISTLLGRLYPPGSPLKDAGYNIFYMGINVGAFVCNFVAAFVRNYVNDHPETFASFGLRGWNAAFCTAGLGMLIGLVVFAVNYRKFADQDQIDRTQERGSLKPLWVLCVIPALLLGVVGFALAGGFKPLAPNLTVLGGIPALWQHFPFNAPDAAFLAACIPVIAFFLYIWRSMKTPQERGQVVALLVVYAVVVVFWMTFHLNTTALNIWARADTDRIPNRAVRVVTDLMPEFAEDAPPAYFDNADAETPRPNQSSYHIISQAEYDQRKNDNTLWDIRKDQTTGKKEVYVYVTEDMFNKIFAKDRYIEGQTPVLDPGVPLKLVNTELFQSINAGQVVLFTPFVVGFFALLRRRGLEPTTPAKMGLGLLINAGAPMMMFLATWASDNSADKVSAWWLIGTYGVATLGELCLSPMGLSLVSKVSPVQITAFMMGGYFLSTSIGNKLSGIFGELYSKLDHYHNPASDQISHYEFWLILVACNLAFGGFIFLILRWLKRQMGSALH